MGKVKDLAQDMLENQFDTPEMQERRESIISKVESTKQEGKRYNKGKVRWRNFPLWLCRPLADIGTYGELKYDESWNFLKGLSVADCIDSLYRHLEDLDNPDLPDEDLESKKSHLGHIAWNALVAYHMINKRPDLDDRYKILLKQQTKEKIEEKKVILPKMQFHVGDLVTSAEGDTIYEVSAIFYTDKLIPAMLIRDQNSNVYTVHQLGHKIYGGSVNL